MMRYCCLLVVLYSTWVSSFSLQGNAGVRKQGVISGTCNHYEESEVDTRPSAARAAFPRQARRVNHGFKYLYRHVALEAGDEDITAIHFLVKYANLTEEQVLILSSTFPPLLTLDVKRHLHPKLLFLQRTLGIHSVMSISPAYFGSRLERIVAPRHAFMVKHGLVSSANYFQQNDHLQQFLVACKSPQAFTVYCNRMFNDTNKFIETAHVEAWDIVFQRGLLSACRKEDDTSWTTQYTSRNDTSCLVQLLLSHGANPLETDSRGATLLHWACGSGNLDAVKCLVPYIDIDCKAERDHGTPLHWAVAGANAREFGIGGHLDVCQYLLEHSTDPKKTVNQVTKDGNSVLMWAAWAGSLTIVKWLIRNRADPQGSNRNGCTVSHWAASGGCLETCGYLKDVVGLDFTAPNHGGNTPLTHAVAFGRVDVVKWLRQEMKDDDLTALELAQDFVLWTDGEGTRKQVLSLFQMD